MNTSVQLSLSLNAGGDTIRRQQQSDALRQVAQKFGRAVGSLAADPKAHSPQLSVGAAARPGGQGGGFGAGGGDGEEEEGEGESESASRHDAMDPLKSPGDGLEDPLDVGSSRRVRFRFWGLHVRHPG